MKVIFAEWHVSLNFGFNQDERVYGTFQGRYDDGDKKQEMQVVKVIEQHLTEVKEE